MSLKERFKNWLIGYKISGMTIEVSLVGYSKMSKELADLEERLTRIAKLTERIVELQDKVKR